MHGLGNDFVVIDRTKCKFSGIEEFAHKLLDRRFGIGGDQLLVVEESESVDYKMRIFNPDGSEVEMCGNGIRCFHKYLLEKGITDKKSLEIETQAGIIKPSLDGDMIRVDMGEPILDGEKIPTRQQGEVFDVPIQVGGGEIKVDCVSMGNPHAVVFVDETSNFPVEKLGPLIENHDFFPKRTNVEFVKIISPGKIQMRVWERGAGETMACGTGACASAVAYIRRYNRSNKKVDVHLKGGTLKIEWDKRVFMTGPAALVFDGEIEVDA